ncbi:MAG: MBOAT family protein [Muribaculaceae bacterium]|nr:MBOAT family protein [Muribaculaceae bacterium]
MQFNSFTFLVFLPVVFVIYWLLARRLRLQNLLVVAASYVFYGWWDPRFLWLIVITSACSFASGLLIEKFRYNRRLKRLVCASNITLNIGILALFKYYNFFAESLCEFLALFNFHPDFVTINLVLPVGISFYTFQALGYTIDTYRGSIRANRDPVAFFAFISFFPQLVAGPIERATSLLPQFSKMRVFNYDKATDGLRQMLWGLFKKMVIADNCAMAVDKIWGDYSNMPGFMLLLGSVLFSFQIYCDFSGYSDIAIGCARLFGIDLMRNFRFPYFSRSIPEFWRRWHISLMTWLRDYIYFPLGGSRCSLLKTIRNIFVVWIISGLWHGADWTFVCWGLFYAFLLSAHRVLGTKGIKDETSAGKTWPSLKEAASIVITFLIVNLGWIVFRAPSMTDAAQYIMAMCHSSLFNLSGSISLMGGLQLTKSVPAIIFLVAVEWMQRNKQHALQLTGNGLMTRSLVLRYTFYVVFIMIILVYSGRNSEFIYFQF